MPDQEKLQDFELIELLIREAGSNVGASPSTSTQQGSDFESFKARFQSYIDQIPSYLHSVSKEGFFPHFFLGSFSTLVDTEIATKLDIKKIYFKFDDSKTLKVAVIRKGGITSQKSAIEKVNLFVISESGKTDSKSKKFTYGELEEILGQSNLPAQNQHIRSARDDLKVKLVKVVKATGEISVEVKDDKLDKNTSTAHEFKEIKKGLWKNPENDIAKLTNSDVEEVKKSSRKVLSKISEVHSKYKGSFTYADKARETAHHGFVAGALVNFRYRHNLRVYLEQFAGRGYADIVLVPRGKDRSLNAIPIIIEMKAATKAELKEGKIGEKSETAPAAALKQAEDYTKGFQPNVMRVLTTANDILCVGVNLDHPSPISNILDKSRNQEIIPLFNEILISIDGRNNGRINEEGLKEKVQNNIKRIYYTLPGTGEKGDSHYFSRFLLGQSLLLNEVQALESNFEKHVFIYGENVPTEAQPEPKSQRLKDKKSKGQDAGQLSNLDQSHGVTTMVFIPENDKKSVYVMNIVETDGRSEVLKKGIPLDQLKQKVGNRKIVEVNLNFNINEKSNFEKYFSMEVSEHISLEQYNNKRTGKFEGSFENVPYPSELKETFDEVLKSQYIDQSASEVSDPEKLKETLNKALDKYKELLGKVGEGVSPFKSLIEKEAHFQAVLHGLFSHYSDIRLGESPESRALILTEFQTGKGKRVDMLVHGVKFADRGRMPKEYIPVGLELKGPREGKEADALKKEANKQISDEYTKGVTYKTLTDGKEVDFVGVVFDKEASNGKSLIQLSNEKEFTPVKVVHSSIFSFSQQQPKNKFNPNLCVQQSSRSKRSIDNCLFSKGNVEEFSKGNVDENNVDKIIIDSEKFLTYVKNSQDEGKNAQLIEFIGNKNIEGDYKYLVDKVIEDQGYERYIQNERIKDLYGDVLQQNSGLTKNPKLKSRLMNAAGGIQLIRGIHGAIVSCKDGTATDCGLNLGGIGWSFASQPIENVMVKIAPKVVTSAEKVVGRIIPGTLGRQTKFAVQVAGVKFGSTIAKGAAGAVAGVFDIIDIGISANNLIDCKNRESSDNPCGEKEIRDNIASISFSGVSFVALTAAGMPVVGIAVGFGLMVGYGIYSGVSNIVEYEKKYDTTHGENWSIFWRTLLFQDMASDVQHLAARKDTVNSLAKGVWQALNNGPNSVVAYGIGLGKVSGNTLRPDYATIMMNRTNANTKNLSRVIPSDIEGASRICLPQITNQDYEKGIKSSVKLAVYYCENAMVISHNNRVKMKQEDKTIVYDLQNVNRGTIVGSNVWNNNFLIYSGTAGIAGGNNVANRFVLVNNPSFSGKIIGGNNSTNILDLSQLKDTVIGVNINYRFKPSAHGQLKVKINNRLLIDDYVSNNLFNYHYIGRQSKVDEILCMGYSEHFTGIDNRDVIIDSGGGSNNNEKDIVENCRKVIISPYTTVKGGKSNYTFYVKAADYKDKGLYSEIDVDGTGTIVFPEFDLLSDCDQITYSTESNTLSLKINFGQNNQFTLDIKNYVEQSSNKPHFVLIDKNGSNIVPKIQRSSSPTIQITSFELHSEHSLDNFDDVEKHYKKILNNDRSYKVLSVIRDKVQNQDNSTAPHMVFGSSGNDVINFDQGTMFARGGKGSDVYVIANDINNKEVKIDNNSDDEKLDMLLMPVVKKDFSIQQCDLHLNYNNTSIQIKNYLQDHNHRHFIIMNKKGEAFIPIIESMSCSPSGKGKLVPFLQATETQDMFLLPKDFEDDHVVIDSRLEDIEKYKDKDDLLLIREGEVPFIIKIEGFYNDQSKWRDVNFLLWKNGNFSPYLGLQQEVNGIIDYQDKLKSDYRKIIKEYNVDFTQSISITHNQDDTLTSLGHDGERIGVVILKNIAPDRIKVSSSGTDLVFSDTVSNHIINIKNWNNSESYRVSTLEFDLGLEPITIRRLDRFSLSEVGKIQDLIGKASENYQNRDKYTPRVENDFKCLISIDSFESENRNPTYQCLGFSSLQDQINFTENLCSKEQIEEFTSEIPNNIQALSLLIKLHNDLLLSSYDKSTLDKCNYLIITSKPKVSNLLFLAVGDSHRFKFLLDNGANVEIKDNNGRTLLNAVACNGNLDMTKLVFDKIEAKSNNPSEMIRLIKSLKEEIISQANIQSDVKEWAESRVSDLRNSIKDVEVIRVPRQAKSNSKISVYYIKGVEDEGRRVQINLASSVKATGKFQGVANKIVLNREAISHLNKVREVSGILMHGMIAKNALADFLSGDYKGVAINLGFIGGGLGLAKIAKAANAKGVDFITDGKLLLGRSLKVASPFLSRSTSAFVVYDLVNQIKKLESGDKDALIPVIGDSIYLGVDAAEVGIEVAEMFGALEGVSSVTGPIGTAIGTVVFIGTDIYIAVKRVDKIDKVVHLTGGEKFIEGLRAFVGMKPTQYIGELMGEKQANDQLVKQGLKYLKQHNDIQRYVFPTGKSVKDNNSCTTVTERGPCTGMSMCNPSITKYEKCQEKIQVDLNNEVLLDRKRANIKWSRTKPDDPDEGKLFCLPAGPIRPGSEGENAYFCHNAIGLSYSADRTGNYTFIDLGEGDDSSRGFIDSPNIFVVNNGFKKYYGGGKDDIFILQGNFIEGNINGGGGVDTIDLEGFAPEVRSIQAELSRGGYISYNNSSFGMENISRISARKNKSDIITLDCNTKYIDGQGGESNDNSDVINIPNNPNFHEMQIIVRPSTNISNNAYNGNFNYTILPKKGRAQINLSSLLGGTSTDRHNFFFNSTISELMGIYIQNVSRIFNYTVKSATFSFLPTGNKSESVFDSNFDEGRFNITISDIPANASYVLSDNTEIKIGKNNLYAMHSTNKTIGGIVKSYPAVADHLRMSLFVNTNNETVVIGHGNHDVISNNFLQKSHLIGGGGENVYVITSGHETIDIENLPIPEVVTYDDFNKKGGLKDTLDLRQLVQQVNSDLSIEPISKVVKNENDLLIKLSISATGLQQDVVTVRLKDAFVNDWYKDLQIILNNAPMKINDNLDLTPLPLTFDEEIVVVTLQDVEEKDELIMSKEAEQLTFLHSEYDLIITNAFNGDVEANKLCTVYLKDFYKEPKMETLSIEFTDKKILLSNEMDKIYNADSFRDKLMSANYIAQLNKKLLTAAKECNLGKIIDLVNQDANVNTTGSNKWTPLHWTASKNCSAEVGYLIKQGANIDAKNDIDRTPAHLAARNCHSSVVLSLVKGRANVDARDKDGKTPSDLASWQKRLNVTSGQECDQAIKHLGKLNQARGKPVQRRRRHRHGDYNRHHNHLSSKPLAIDSSNQPGMAASSGARSSSWINDLFSWVKSSVGGLFYSRAVLPEETSSTTSSISQVDAPMDVNGTIMLLDMLARKVTGQKYISTADQPISPLEAQVYALNITQKFEKVLNETAIKSGISVTNLNFDPVAVQSAIVGQIISKKFSKIPKTLYSFAREACPEFKQTGKFLVHLRSKLEGEKEAALLQQKVEKPSKILDQQVSGKIELSKKPNTFLNGTSVVKGISSVLER